MKKQQRQKCEVYSRVVGYLRPVAQWNEGKQEEFRHRQAYQVPCPENTPASRTPTHTH